MIERYTLPEMGRIWSEENKLRNWMQIEVLACEAWANLGVIPLEAAQNIRAKANFDIAGVQKIEEEVRHDVIAFLTNMGSYIGEDSKYVHLGMTSSDILDTGIAMQMRDSADIILDKLEKFKAILGRLAVEHKNTLMVGRTHGVHGEPVTFGLKMALWYTEIERGIERVQRAKEIASYGKISGAVGTFANVDPLVEKYVCEKLGLKPAKVSTQIIQRDRHAEYLTALALVASSLEKMATEIRNLQRTDILEVEEPFHKGQKGSSAMPHKRNPMMSERVAGLARVIRTNALAGMENVALWHERDLTHSSVERVILPDSSILLDYILEKFTKVMDGLVVYPENMMTNLEATMGLVFSQRVLLTLIEKGLLREEAYKLVQTTAMESWRTKVPFRELLDHNVVIMKYLSKEELDSLFDYGYHLKHVDYILGRCGL
ncbi:MAG: adenylosuccinate lyase [Candidatus Saccharibacteria bacterium]